MSTDTLNFAGPKIEYNKGLRGITTDALDKKDKYNPAVGKPFLHIQEVTMFSYLEKMVLRTSSFHQVLTEASTFQVADLDINEGEGTAYEMKLMFETNALFEGMSHAGTQKTDDVMFQCAAKIYVTSVDKLKEKVKDNHLGQDGSNPTFAAYVTHCLYNGARFLCVNNEGLALKAFPTLLANESLGSIREERKLLFKTKQLRAQTILFTKVLITNQITKHLLGIESKASGRESSYNESVLEAMQEVSDSQGDVRKFLRALLNSIEGGLASAAAEKVKEEKDKGEKVREGLQTWTDVKEKETMMPDTHSKPYTVIVPAGCIPLMIDSSFLRVILSLIELANNQKAADFKKGVSPRKRKRPSTFFPNGPNADGAKTTFDYLDKSNPSKIEMVNTGGTAGQGEQEDEDISDVIANGLAPNDSLVDEELGVASSKNVIEVGLELVQLQNMNVDKSGEEDAQEVDSDVEDGKDEDYDNTK